MFAVVLLAALTLAACHREEHAVAGLAKDAEKAEHQAQIRATERDQERAQLDQIPIPTKSLYIDIHDPSQWTNPFLSVGAGMITLRILLPDENPSPVGQGTLLRIDKDLGKRRKCDEVYERKLFIFHCREKGDIFMGEEP